LYPGGEVVFYRWFYYGVGSSNHDVMYKLASVEFTDGTSWDAGLLKSWNGVGALTWRGPGFEISAF
jgi:hypothetical protein